MQNASCAVYADNDEVGTSSAAPSSRPGCVRLIFGIVVTSGCLALEASAGETPAPAVGDHAIEAAKRLRPAITESDLERARTHYRMPTDAELARVPVPSTPNLDALPQPKGSIDVEALARRHQATEGRSGPAAFAQPALLVFVSLSLPEPTLTRLIDQAARSRAVLVMRGLKNASLVQTAAHVRRLIGSRQVAWQIDPQAFDRFGVGKVPSFVLVRAGAQLHACGEAQCMAPEGFAAVSGDVSTDYALEAIERRAPAFAGEARLFLARLRG